jgi:hypothetical protein
MNIHGQVKTIGDFFGPVIMQGAKLYGQKPLTLYIQSQTWKNQGYSACLADN